MGWGGMGCTCTGEGGRDHMRCLRVSALCCAALRPCDA